MEITKELTTPARETVVFKLMRDKAFCYAMLDELAEYISEVDNLKKQLAERDAQLAALYDVLFKAERALDDVFLRVSYVATQGVGLQPPAKRGNPQLVKVPLGEIKAILLGLADVVRAPLGYARDALAFHKATRQPTQDKGGE